MILADHPDTDDADVECHVLLLFDAVRIASLGQALPLPLPLPKCLSTYFWISLRMKRPEFVGALLPGEHTGGEDAVKADRSKASEELVPVHLALADVHVLVDRHLSARRVADVAKP